MVAMFPPTDPDFIIYVNIKLPTKSWTLRYISRVVNPMLTLAEARKSEIFQTTDVAKAGKVTINDYTRKSPGNITDELRQTSLQPVLVGSTTDAGVTIRKQSIKAGTKVNANTRVLLLTSGSSIMPDMYGWSKEQVEQVAQWYNLEVSYSGSGKTVTEQSIVANSQLSSKQKLKSIFN